MHICAYRRLRKKIEEFRDTFGVVTGMKCG
jgi:hypothetical protein